MASRWKNPYIDRVAGFPDLVLDINSSDDPAFLAQELIVKTRSYKQLFLEFGSGSGGHLIAHAKLNLAALWVGFELRFKRTVRTAEKAKREGLTNLLVLRTSAQRAPIFFGPSSIDGIFVNFPDPWGKPRWAKHRMLNEQFIRSIHNLLRPGGVLSYKTDHQGCFDETNRLLQESGLFHVSKLTYDLKLSPYAQGNIQSEFERLFYSKGIAVNFLEATRHGC